MAIDELIDVHARIAVYDDLISSPRIIDIPPASIIEFIEAIATGTYEHARAKGGRLPYTVIREIAENFIHADFKECTVSVLDDGNTVRFSDQGPGIKKKELVLQPGVSSATSSMKQYIRGVGSGFPIVREYLELVNGFLSIDDNAIDGTIITLSITPPDELPSSIPAQSLSRFQVISDQPSFTTSQAASRSVSQSSTQNDSYHNPRVPSGRTDTPGNNREDTAVDSQPYTGTERLKAREERALFLLYKEGMLGTGDLVEPLGISAPTASRLLQRLELLGFVEESMSRKRILSNKGLVYVQTQDQQEN